jgi:hypothetical protein
MGTKNNKMSEKMNAITISRRSNRLFVEEQQLLEAGKAGGHESRQISGDEKERDRPQRETVSTSSSIKVLQMPVVELGMALCPIFPTTSEDIGKQGTLLLTLSVDYAFSRTICQILFIHSLCETRC